MISTMSKPQVRPCSKSSSKEQCSEVKQDLIEATTFKQSSIAPRFARLSSGADRQITRGQ